MKFLQILAASLPLIFATYALAKLPPWIGKLPPGTACKCAPGDPCPDYEPERCQCENRNAQRCADFCGTKYIPKPCPQVCGGFTNIPSPCPDGLTCIDNPTKPGCYLASDCPGLCVRLDGPMCSGIAGLHCPDTKEYCVDDPYDNCDPPNGADCAGVCVYLDGSSASVFQSA